MTDSIAKTLPWLIVVTGRPGSGKTSLAHLLAREVRCPVICRDEIKEGLVNTTQAFCKPNDAVGAGVYEAFFQTLNLLLGHGVTLIAEAAFQHKLWAPKLEMMKSLARIRIIICDVDPAVARQRHIDRGLADPDREKFHDDDAVKGARHGRHLPLEPYDPPHLDVPSLRVDTAEGYQPGIERIVLFALTCAEKK